MVDEKKKKTMVVESSNKENKNYLTREEFINKLKANSLEIKNNEINERNAKRDLAFEPIRNTKRNNYNRSSRVHNRNNYKNYSRQKVKENNNIAPVICGLFLITILFMKFVNVPFINNTKSFINNSISEVKPIDEVFNNLFIFNENNNIDRNVEDFSFSETIENDTNYENMSIEQLKTMTDFEIEEDLFLEKK